MIVVGRLSSLVNSIVTHRNCIKMNQQCKVCGEPAAGFHFGAFTCEGCKSFFGRSYNNLSSISECKNGGECVINKKNRTACKACRLRKCLLVGMSKSGSRYGRRSNWFKIHCLLQEQQQQQQHHQQQQHQQHQRHQLQHQQHQQQQQQQQQQQGQKTNPTSPSIVGHHTRQQRNKEDSLMLGLDDYKNSTSPSISSPESHNSDSSVEVSERRAAYGLHPGFRPLHPAHLHPHGELSALSKEMMSLPLGFHLGGMSLIPPAFLPPPSLTMFSPYHHLYGGPHASGHPGLMTNHSNATLRSSPIGSSNSTTIGMMTNNTGDSNDLCNNNVNSNNNYNNNNNRHTRNHNVGSSERSSVSPIMEPTETCNKRFYLDAILKSQRTPMTRSPASSKTRSAQNSPRESPDRDIDCIPPQDNPIDLSMKANNLIVESGDESDDDRDVDMLDRNSDRDSPPLKRRPIDLTTRS